MTDLSRTQGTRFLLRSSYKQKTTCSGEENKNGGVKTYETSLICLNIFWAPHHPQWFPVVKWGILFSKLQTWDSKEGIFTTRSHSKHIILCLFLMCGFCQKKDPLCLLLYFRTLWWQSHLEILCKEFATCQHSVSYPANQLVILSIEDKLNFVT